MFIRYHNETPGGSWEDSAVTSNMVIVKEWIWLFKHTDLIENRLNILRASLKMCVNCH